MNIDDSSEEIRIGGDDHSSVRLDRRIESCAECVAGICGLGIERVQHANGNTVPSGMVIFSGGGGGGAGAGGGGAAC